MWKRIKLVQEANATDGLGKGRQGHHVCVNVYSALQARTHLSIYAWRLVEHLEYRGLTSHEER